jgi:hypothetical protein
MHGVVALQAEKMGHRADVLATIVPLEQSVEGVIGWFRSMIADEQGGGAAGGPEHAAEGGVIKVVGHPIEDDDVGRPKFLTDGIGVKRLDSAP